MAEQSPLNQFDNVIGAMEKKIVGMEEKGYLPNYLEKLKDRRGELIHALEKGDEEKAAEIIDLAIGFGNELNKLKAKRPSPLQFLGTLVPKRREKKKKIAAAPKKEKVAAKKEATAMEGVYDDELKSISTELAKRDVELEGLKGAYAKMSAEMGEMRRKMQAQEAKDVKALSAQIKELKGGMDSVHSTMDKEFASSKAAYREFGLELLGVAVKVAELEELIERGDTITEMDVLELHNSVALLAKGLMVVEAKQKKNRVALVERMKRDQKKMMKVLASKADTGKMVNAIKQHAKELRVELEEQDTKLAAEMHVELKSSYYTLGQKLERLEKALGKAKTKKDLAAIKKKVGELSTHIDKVREEELGMQRELDQQHLSDRALMQRIDSVSGRLEKRAGKAKPPSAKPKARAAKKAPAKKKAVKKRKKAAPAKKKAPKKKPKKKQLFGLLGG